MCNFLKLQFISFFLNTNIFQYTFNKAISKNLKKLISNAHVIQRQPGKLGQGPIGNQLMTTNTDLA